jgi:2-haloacid dehalogenase
MGPAVVFDVNETLLDLSGLQDAFLAIGLSPEALPLWFARTQRDGFGFAAAGDWRSFREIGIATLSGLAPTSSPAQRASVLDALSTCSLHDDVAPGIAQLHGAGITMATLTVGSSAVVADVFSRAGIAHVTHLSCDAIQRWKPAERAYRYAADHLQSDDITMISCHQWDLHGASRVGFGTAWLNRSGAPPNPLYAEPNLQADTLPALVSLLAT